jgi:hypothetical protein
VRERLQKKLELKRLLEEQICQDEEFLEQIQSSIKSFEGFIQTYDPFKIVNGDA